MLLNKVQSAFRRHAKPNYKSKWFLGKHSIVYDEFLASIFLTTPTIIIYCLFGAHFNAMLPTEHQIIIMYANLCMNQLIATPVNPRIIISRFTEFFAKQSRSMNINKFRRINVWARLVCPQPNVNIKFFFSVKWIRVTWWANRLHVNSESHSPRLYRFWNRNYSDSERRYSRNTHWFSNGNLMNLLGLK